MATKPGRRRIEKYRAARKSLERRQKEMEVLKPKDLVPRLKRAFADLTKRLPKEATRVILDATARWVLRQARATSPWEVLDREQPDFLDRLEAKHPGIGPQICKRMMDVGFFLSEIVRLYGLPRLEEITELTVRLHHGKEVRRGRGRKAKRGWEEGP